MDVRMPEMDGLEATKRIRSLDRSDAKKIPIIAMTANTMEEDVSRIYEAGINSHIRKPMSIRTLQKHLRRVYRK
jgi:CheY-like chemotaxis protein